MYSTKYSSSINLNLGLKIFNIMRMDIWSEKTTTKDTDILFDVTNKSHELQASVFNKQVIQRSTTSRGGKKKTSCKYKL